MFGQRLRLARKRAGLSMQALSQRMSPPVTAQAISKYEADRMMPSSAVLVGLGKALGVSLDFLMGGQVEALEDLNDAWSDETFWFTMMSGPDDAPKASDIVADQRERLAKLNQSGFGGEVGFAPSQEIADLLPRTVRAYTAFAVFTAIADEDVVAEEEPWEAVKVALIEDLRAGADLSGYQGAGAEELRAAQAGLADQPEIDYKQAFIDMNEASCSRPG